MSHFDQMEQSELMSPATVTGDKPASIRLTPNRLARSSVISAGPRDGGSTFLSTVIVSSYEMIVRGRRFFAFIACLILARASSQVGGCTLDFGSNSWQMTTQAASTANLLVRSFVERNF